MGNEGASVSLRSSPFLREKSKGIGERAGIPFFDLFAFFPGP